MIVTVVILGALVVLLFFLVGALSNHLLRIEREIEMLHRHDDDLLDQITRKNVTPIIRDDDLRESAQAKVNRILDQLRQPD